MLEMLGRSSNQFSARHTSPGCLRGPLLILSPSACATVAHLFPSSSLLGSLPAPCPALGRTVLETLGFSHHPPPQA